MARINVSGDAVVVVSALKLKDIEMVKKYRPNALILMGGEDGKTPIFGISVTNGHGEINQYGATFNAETRDDEKLAMLTVMTYGVTDDAEEFIEDRLGGSITNLNKLEATLPGVIEEINAEREAVRASITILQ